MHLHGRQWTRVDGRAGLGNHRASRSEAPCQCRYAAQPRLSASWNFELVGLVSRWRLNCTGTQEVAGVESD